MSRAEQWWVAEGRARELFRADAVDAARWADLTAAQRKAYRDRAQAAEPSATPEGGRARPRPEEMG